MQRHALLRWQIVEHPGPAVGVREVPVAEQPARLEGPDGVGDHVHVHPDQSAQQRLRGVTAQHRQAPDHGQPGRSAAAQAGQQRLPIGAAGHVPAGPPVVQQGVQQQRVAAAGAEERRRQPVRGRRPAALSDQLGGAPLRQPADRDQIAVRVPQQLGPGRRETRVRADVAGQHHQHRGRPDPPGQREQPQHRLRVGVLHIVHRDQRR
ncbi:hypothetical protein [Streptomyces rapamycinicus]|uniref:hypothetical protein n=1 Tax=Streptomyces rapamycinicus TaxID=1226757 RepID=UPI0032D98778